MKYVISFNKESISWDLYELFKDGSHGLYLSGLKMEDVCKQLKRIADGKIKIPSNCKECPIITCEDQGYYMINTCEKAWIRLNKFFEAKKNEPNNQS